MGIPMNTKEKILQALRKVRDDYHNRAYDFDEYVGICSNVNRALYMLELYGVSHNKELGKLFKTWPKYSGDPDYPVPCPVNDFSAQEAYNLAGGMWDGKYGELRVQLLNHCIQELEKVCA